MTDDDKFLPNMLHACCNNRAVSRLETCRKRALSGQNGDQTLRPSYLPSFSVAWKERRDICREQERIGWHEIRDVHLTVYGFTIFTVLL